jgi:hypothetical protein
MNAKYFFSSVFLLLVILSGCDMNLFNEDHTVNIRIENASEFEMENIMVSFPKEEVSYGDLGASSSSSYKEIDKAYSYAYIEAEIEGERAVLQPIDFVGEKFLNRGSYTYQLYIISQDESPEGEGPRYSLAIELKKS